MYPYRNLINLCCLGFLFCLSFSLSAATIYKSKNKDGLTVYSNQEPPRATRVQVITMEDAPSTPLPEAVQRYQEGLLKNARKHSTVRPDDNLQPVLFSAKWCGYCRKAKEYLAKKGVGYKEYDIDTEEGMRNLVAVTGGSKGVPVLLWKGQQVTGFSPDRYDNILARK